MDFIAQDNNFETRIRESFSRQPFMDYMGASIKELKPGFCEIHVPYKKELSQQHGYFHAGVVGTLADNAAGYAAYTLMAADSSVLTVEYKLNLMAPGDGEFLVVKSHVLKYGRTLTICRSDVFIQKNGNEKLCAAAQVTLIELKNTPDK
jgi:uncharacterized protein (TIGR00369 family)